MTVLLLCRFHSGWFSYWCLCWVLTLTVAWLGFQQFSTELVALMLCDSFFQVQHILWIRISVLGHFTSVCLRDKNLSLKLTTSKSGFQNHQDLCSTDGQLGNESVSVSSSHSEMSSAFNDNYKLCAWNEDFWVLWIVMKPCFWQRHIAHELWILLTQCWTVNSVKPSCP